MYDANGLNDADLWPNRAKWVIQELKRSVASGLMLTRDEAIDSALSCSSLAQSMRRRGRAVVHAAPRNGDTRR